MLELLEQLYHEEEESRGTMERVDWEEQGMGEQIQGSTARGCQGPRVPVDQNSDKSIL